MGRCSIAKRTIQMTKLLQYNRLRSTQMTVRRAIILFGPMFATTAGFADAALLPFSRCRYHHEAS